MGYEKIESALFNRRAADPENKPDRILEALSLKAGDTVADIGSGGGYFALRFSEAVGAQGRVYVVDVNPAFLDIIRQSLNDGVKNVEAVLAVEGAVPLPEKSLDAVFMRNVYHHLQDRAEYFRRLGRLLKRDGKIAIIENNPGGIFSFSRIFGHHTEKGIIAEEMRKAGYKVDGSFDFLPRQSFTIFSLADA